MYFRFSICHLISPSFQDLSYLRKETSGEPIISSHIRPNSIPNVNSIHPSSSRFRDGRRKPPRAFNCRYCGKICSARTALANHERIHTGERPYKCKICNKSFNQSGNLHKHERIHTGQRPYECAFCKKSFIQSADLNRHVRRHTGEQPYECQKCLSTFSDFGKLQNHERCHFMD